MSPGTVLPVDIALMPFKAQPTPDGQPVMLRSGCVQNKGLAAVLSPQHAAAQVVAHEENQKYKEGKFILERACMLDLYEGNFASSTDVAALSIEACE